MTHSAPSKVELADIDSLDFAKGAGLLPVIVQDQTSGAVLMLGYMNREALAASFARGRAVFFSRSKQRLWEKGETSGHHLQIIEIRTDCDRDTLLLIAEPRGPVCHLGTRTCFGDVPPAPTGALAFLPELEALIAQRRTQPPAGSYTARLFAEGPKRIAQKVGEEGLEVALASIGGSDAEVLSESADLLYHLLVLLRTRDLGLERVVAELAARHVKP